MMLLMMISKIGLKFTVRAPLPVHLQIPFHGIEALKSHHAVKLNSVLSGRAVYRLDKFKPYYLSCEMSAIRAHTYVIECVSFDQMSCFTDIKNNLLYK